MASDTTWFSDFRKTKAAAPAAAERKREAVGRQVGAGELLIHGIRLLDWAAHVCVYVALLAFGRFALVPLLSLLAVFVPLTIVGFSTALFLDATGEGGPWILGSLILIGTAFVYAKYRTPDHYTYTTVNEGFSSWQVQDIVRTALTAQAREIRHIQATRHVPFVVEPAAYSDSEYVSGSRLHDFQGLKHSEESYWRTAEQAQRERSRGPFSEP
jgi:hypothetical protein